MIDTHIHLNDKAYEKDYLEVIERSKKSGVSKVIIIGCDKEGIKKGLKLIKEDNDNFLFLAIGWHPVDVRTFSDNELNKIKEHISSNNKIVGIGEIGLDYHWHPEEKEEQIEAFRKQLRLAKELKTPIIVHSREAYVDCFKIMEEEDYFYGVMHSFADTYEMAKKFLDKGMYIGISGPITFKNGHNQKDVVKNMDINKLLIETDGPYLTPVPYRGKRNESAYLEEICKTIAEVKLLPIDEIKKITTRNAKNLFKELND